MSDTYIKTFTNIYDYSQNLVTPSVTLLAGTGSNPFTILISTIISLRTKDEVTLVATRRLFADGTGPWHVLKLGAEEIARRIFPAGFYKTKAQNIYKIASIILNTHDGTVPSTEVELLQLPGVGRKTMNLVRSEGFGLDSICVDTHVHRISNRLGWVCTTSPEETENSLKDIFPVDYWRKLNHTLVAFGQQTCTPRSPICSKCPVHDQCPQKGVTAQR